MDACEVNSLQPWLLQDCICMFYVSHTLGTFFCEDPTSHLRGLKSEDDLEQSPERKWFRLMIPPTHTSYLNIVGRSYSSNKCGLYLICFRREKRILAGRQETWSFRVYIEGMSWGRGRLPHHCCPPVCEEAMDVGGVLPPVTEWKDQSERKTAHQRSCRFLKSCVAGFWQWNSGWFYFDMKMYLDSQVFIFNTRTHC